MGTRLIERNDEIVGAGFWPPAAIVLDNLPVDWDLKLMAEPDNPHDVNAMLVKVHVLSLPSPNYVRLVTALVAAGHAIADEFKLGYLRRDVAEYIGPYGNSYVVKFAKFQPLKDGRPGINYSLTTEPKEKK